MLPVVISRKWDYRVGRIEGREILFYLYLSILLIFKILSLYYYCNKIVNLKK